MQPTPFQTFAHLTSPMLTGSYLAGTDLNTRSGTVSNALSTACSPCLAGAFPTSLHLARPSLSAPRRSTPLGVATEMISCEKPSRCKQPLPSPTFPGLSRPHPSIDYRCPPHTRRSTFSNALSTVVSPCCSTPGHAIPHLSRHRHSIPIPSASDQTEIHQVGWTLLYLLHIRFVNTRYNMFCKIFT
jgi:hypothetical protein